MMKRLVHIFVILIILIASTYAILPTLVKPTKYDIEISIDSFSEDTFVGFETIYFDFVDPEVHTNEIYLNFNTTYVRDNNFVYINGNYSNNCVLTTQTEVDNGIIRITCDDTDLSGPNNFIEFPWFGNYSENGIYKKVIITNEDETYEIGTNFEQYNARMAIPSFDEEGYDAPVTLKLRYDEGYNATSDTEIIDVLGPNAQDQVYITFAETEAIPISSLHFKIFKP